MLPVLRRVPQTSVVTLDFPLFYASGSLARPDLRRRIGVVPRRPVVKSLSDGYVVVHEPLPGDRVHLAQIDFVYWPSLAGQILKLVRQAQLSSEHHEVRCFSSGRVGCAPEGPHELGQ